jgi:hypothetical protein
LPAAAVETRLHTGAISLQRTLTGPSAALAASAGAESASTSATDLDTALAIELMMQPAEVADAANELLHPPVLLESVA